MLEKTENRLEKLEDELSKLKNENEILKLDIIRYRKNISTLGKILKEKQEMWDYFEKRFVQVTSECSPEEQELCVQKCVAYPDQCEGHCKRTRYIDLMSLLESAVEEGHIN